MAQDQVEPVDPAELTVWLKMMQNAKKHLQPTQSSDPSQVSAVANPSVMAGQQETGLDPATMAQGASAQLPSAQPPQPPQPPQAQQPPPQAPQDPSQHGVAKGAAQQALMKLAEAQNVPDSIAVEKGQVDNLKKQIADYMAKPRGIDFSPIAALTDSWTGSNFAKSYKAPQTDAERIETMAKLQNMVAQREGDLTKQQTALLNAKTGANKALAGTDKDPVGAMYAQVKQNQMDNSAHQRVLHAVKKDPVLTGMFQQSRRLSAALDFVDQATVTTPQQLDEMQQTVRRQLGITGTSGVDERSKTMLDSMGLKSARAQQYLFGTPVDVKESSQEFVQHLRDLVAVAQKNTSTQADAQLSKLTAGNPDLYERRPDLRRGLDEVTAASKGQFTPEALSAYPAKSKAAPAPAAGEDAAAAARNARIAELRKKLGK